MSNQPFYWLNDLSRTFLSKGYLQEGETAEQRVKQIADRAETLLGISGFSDKFYNYMSKGYYSLSSPVWSNYGRSNRSMPVSCFGSSIQDSVTDILQTAAEIGQMSKFGGGTAIDLSNLRSRGESIHQNGESSGAVSFLELFQAVTATINQGSRRGKTAAYLDVSHPDIDEFLDVGTEGNLIQSMTTGVVIPEGWMQSMIAGDYDKRVIWAKVIKRRSEIGYPYILYKDNVNDNKPEVYKDLNLDINHSQLCSEILLPTDENNSFVCVLSSMNLLNYDEWKNTDAVETLVYFLDSVITEFLTKLEMYRDSPTKEDQGAFRSMSKAYNFAKTHRALGLGVLGWHSLLQSKLLPFDSKDTAKLNLEVSKLIKNRSYKASEELATRYGEPSLLKGYGRRNTTLTAIAPTTSSAFMLGQVSQSIEPIFSNCYIKDVANSKVVIKNLQLQKILEDRGHNTKQVWDAIRDADGSVQHLPDSVLSQELKKVFLTFQEVDQEVILYQAAVRQDCMLDQTQSLNLKVGNNLTPKEISQLHIKAWRLGISTLYYMHSVNFAQDMLRSGCVACEG